MASENLLQRLPSTLGKLQSLKVLAIDENRLTSLPDECKWIDYDNVSFQIIEMPIYMLSLWLKFSPNNK